MSGTFPTSSGFTGIDFRSENSNLRSDAINGRTQVRKVGGHRWQFTVSFPPMKRAAFGPINSFVQSQEGMLDTFQIVLPEYSHSQETITGTLQASQAQTAGQSAINMDTASGTLKAGDMFKFANHSKVYMATADTALPGTVSFNPPLVASVADNEIVTVNSVPFTVRLNNDIQEAQAGIGGLFRYELDMIEAV